MLGAQNITPQSTHSGYFSIDKKSRRLTDSKVATRGENAGQSDDVDAYDLILKDKARLLSLAESVRFIFSHSALREGWDNPNVFVICTLKHSDNTISRRQEVGRGLRLAVNQQGERMDHPATVHDINVLTVVASESYQDFVAALQKDISDSLASRPRHADEAYFAGKVLRTASGDVMVTPQMAKQVYFYLVKNGYTDDSDQITAAYHSAKQAQTLAALPDGLQPHADSIFQLIDSVFSPDRLKNNTENGRKAKTILLNKANFHKKEFQTLWQRINRKAAYEVKFDSSELIGKAVATLNDAHSGLRVTPLLYTIQTGTQAGQISVDMLNRAQGFQLADTLVAIRRQTIHTAVKYDLIGKIAQGTQLTRRAVAQILTGISAKIFAQFKTNPESFISEAVRIINEQKATVIIEHLSYSPLEDTFSTDIFTAAQTRQDFSQAGEKLKRHIYDYALTDSNTERAFVQQLDTARDVVVYAKLPRGFHISTPVGNYNPDWAIAFKEGSVKHVYFVAETKGSMRSMELRKIEDAKIECARRFFNKINADSLPQKIEYDVVEDFGKLMELVK